MECQRHDKQLERRTGGDFGLTMVRPDIHAGGYRPSIAMKQQGLLCQAKLKKRTGGWRELSLNQREVLPSSFPFAALTLYEYRDRKRHRLKPFAWQSCSGAQLADVVGWLRKSTFPHLQTSKEVLTALAEDRLGTGEREIIRETIAPKGRRTIHVRIDWPDGARPEDLENLVKTAQPQVQYAYVRA